MSNEKDVQQQNVNQIHCLIKSLCTSLSNVNVLNLKIAPVFVLVRLLVQNMQTSLMLVLFKNMLTIPKVLNAQIVISALTTSNHCYRDGGGMAGQGPQVKVAAAKQAMKSAKPELVAFMEDLDDAELSCASIEGVSDELVELVVNSWSTLLDSGATAHFVKGREYFWSYNEEAAQNVKTANPNLGILQIRASGTCVAWLYLLHHS